MLETLENGLPAQRLHRSSRSRTFLMCAPEHFCVVYSINAWMDPAVPVDRVLARHQWEAIRDAYQSAGHTVHLLNPHPDAPDMVFAANGGLTIGGKTLLARFRYEERSAEVPGHQSLLQRLGKVTTPSSHVSEGEGDFLVGSREVFAGWGFRCSLAAHAELATELDVPVVSLRLVDERFYHLDTAMYHG